MKITEIPAKQEEAKVIRVAVYVRVSADKDAAFHSLKAQKAYYEEYIKKNPRWELVDIYSDNGVSGTTINRLEFQRMIEDCRKKKVDLIITKSITRFARNTTVLLETIRELKALGVDVLFEKENMHSISPDGELLLTLLAMYAEEEARSVSENQKWRIAQKFENGEPWVGDMLGYRLINKKLVIVPEEAEIVKNIFNWYLAGMGAQAIAKRLNDAGIPARYADHWHANVILGIIHNEKYTGNMLLQKTFRPDFKTKRSKKNNGEVRQYYVENSHQAIIDSDTFNAAQEEAKRRKLQNSCLRDNHRNAIPNLFTGLMSCGFCGSAYRKRTANAPRKPTPVWICNRYYELGKSSCPSQQIPEDILIEKTKEVLQTDTINRDLLLSRIVKIVVTDYFKLQYRLSDGTVHDVVWKHKSRKESWTKEMREKARQKALLLIQERRRKEKNEQGNEGNDH